MSEQVNHPDHYQFGDREVLDMMYCIWGKDGVIDFCMMNAFKYRMRAGYKENTEQDIAKAMWYESKAKELQTK